MQHNYMSLKNNIVVLEKDGWGWLKHFEVNRKNHNFHLEKAFETYSAWNLIFSLIKIAIQIKNTTENVEADNVSVSLKTKQNKKTQKLSELLPNDVKVV